VVTAACALGRTMSTHPRFRGQVIDAHCHFDAGTRGRAAEVARLAEISTAISLWDCKLPPPAFVADREAWRRVEPTLMRCHVPDLSRVGEPGFAARVAHEAREAVAQGAVGIKVWKNLGLWEVDVAGVRVAVDDERLEPLWSVAAELDVPIVIHVGDPPAFFAPVDDENPRIEELRQHPDWWWGGPEFPSLAQLHSEFERVVAANPATVFIAAHFGCFMSWADVARMLASYPNYHVDTAAALADMGRQSTSQVRDIIINHAERIVFGTDLIRTGHWDMPEQQERWELGEFFARHWRFFETAGSDLEHPLPAQGPWRVTGIDLPDAVLELIYAGNAKRLFKVYSD